MKKMESKNVCRYFCAVILLLVSSAPFFFVWHRFASGNDTTRWLPGMGGMSVAADKTISEKTRKKPAIQRLSAA